MDEPVIKKVNYDIKPLTGTDKDKVAAFLAEAYFPDDPLMQAMNISVADEDQIQHIVRFIDEGYSYCAVLPDGEILGVLICGKIDTNGIEHTKEEKKTCKSVYFQKLLDFYVEMAEGSKIFEVMGHDKALETHIAAVKPSARRSGIMLYLFLNILKVTKEEFKLYVCTCNSQYTARLCQSLGWECVYCLPFIYFKDAKGNRLFPNPVSPHLHVSIYCHNLDT